MLTSPKCVGLKGFHVRSYKVIQAVTTKKGNGCPDTELLRTLQNSM